MGKTTTKQTEYEPLIAPEDENFPDRRRWTRAECERLVKIGFLTGRYELIDGEIISKMSQNPSHAIVIMLLTRLLQKWFGENFTRIQLPVTIPNPERNTNDPEPDGAITALPYTSFLTQHPGPEDIVLLVEVSDSTLKSDLGTKARLYARIGIAEYWVADIPSRRLHRHRQPTRSGYAETAIFEAGQSVSPLARLEAFATVSDLFPPLPDAAAQAK